MKLPGFCVLILVLALCSAGTAYAQEAGMSDLEVTVEVAAETSEATFGSGGEVRFIPQTPGYVPAKDSIMLQISDFPMQRAAQRPQAAKQADKPKAKDDDSILTFNFLYYIVQKYKLQDIID